MLIIVSIYTAGVVVWNLLRLTPLAAWGPFELADLFGWLLFVPLPVLAVIAALRRRWSVLLVLLLPVVVFALEYGPQFMPHRVPEGDGMRFVTANVYLFNPQPAELDQTIEGLGADVIALQELGTITSARLTELLGDRYPHRALHPRRDANGLGVFSRFPLHEEVDIETSPGSCRCQVVHLELPSGEVTLINAHARRPTVSSRGFDTSVQSNTVRSLIDRVQAARSPVVLLGDLNVGDRHYFYRAIRRHLGDAHRDAGWGLGLTWMHEQRWPLFRIDYIFRDDLWQTRTAHSGTLPGSDHRYVAADLVPVAPD